MGFGMVTDANTNGASTGTYSVRLSMSGNGAVQATMVVWDSMSTLYDPQFVREKAWKRSRAGAKKARCEQIENQRARAKEARKQRRKQRKGRS